MVFPLMLSVTLILHDRLRQTAEARAVAFLIKEVPRWRPENKCYSCHNNGDAARALFVAMRENYSVPQSALKDTTQWLCHPEKWDHDKGEPGFSDKGLSRIQFAAALVEAADAGAVKDRQPLKRAAKLVRENQKRDGSWQIGAKGTIGSPVTYGSCLATYQARAVLKSADAARYRSAIAKADQWLRAVPAKTTLDAAAILLALERANDKDACAQRDRCLGLIRKGQASNGGWGPYSNSPPEPFDTAIVLLALANHRAGRNVSQRGRAFLISTQQPDGSWPETTRPAGAVSYAQRVSTTAWATLALIVTRPGAQ
jgi:hypothetical protein